MAHGYAGNISNLIELSQGGGFGHLLSNTRVATGAHKLSNNEENNWNNDIQVITQTLIHSGIPLNDTFILLEYDIPGHLGRCDMLIIGRGSNNTNNALVVELKRWKDFEAIEGSKYVKVIGVTLPHPAEQVLQYRDKLEAFHEYADKFVFQCAVWMTVIERTRMTKLESAHNNDCLLWSNDIASPEISCYLLDHFSAGIKDDAFNAFASASCAQNTETIYRLLQRVPNLTRGVSDALNRPLDLTEEQQDIVSAIGLEARRHKKCLVIVTGEPGAGKTIIGLHSLIDQLAFDMKSRVVLALRNNRLCHVVRSAIDDATGIKIGSALIQYVKGGGPNAGIYPKVVQLENTRDGLPIYDLVVLDEAHRVPHENPTAKVKKLTQLESILKAGRIVVCLLDEGQRLNEDDSGNAETIENIWTALYPDAPVFNYSLLGQHRISKEYMDWLTSLLAGDITKLPASFSINIVNTPKDAINYLNSFKDKNECGLLASYTFANGRAGRTLRIESPPVHWLMTPPEYDRWWREKSFRHSFSHCSSVYGCQGFELDYVGLFWGRDLSMSIERDKVHYDICSPHNIVDDIGGAFGKKFHTLADLASNNQEEKELVVKRLINRYRILLSRARKGIVICCEDPETAAVLRKIFI